MSTSRRRNRRTFSYRAGVRVLDSVLACDATSGGDLIFVSHAGALDERGAHGLPRARGGRRKILTTETTLALLGAAGQRLRPHALTAAYGRPFNLGSMRLELFRSGHLPGSASLLCEREGQRIVYAGAIGAMAPAGPGAEDAPEIRVAEALCIDGTFGARRFLFPPRAEALARIRGLVADSLAAGRPPVVLASPENLLAIGGGLGSDGIAVRAHRRVVAAGAAHRQAGLPAPALARFSGKLAAREALLWPPDARHAAILKTLARPVFIFASGWAADPATAASMQADAAVPLSTLADFDGLLRYVKATSAREVAVQHAGDDELCRELQSQGLDAYPVGPPQQIALF